MWTGDSIAYDLAPAVAAALAAAGLRADDSSFPGTRLIPEGGGTSLLDTLAERLTAKPVDVVVMQLSVWDSEQDADEQYAALTALRDLVTRARSGRLRGAEVTGATCTVTSLGDAGVEKVFGIIHPPQVALVGFGAVLERPWAHEGWVSARPVLTATLSADHRASDGQRGARFLERLAERLERPETL